MSDFYTALEIYTALLKEKKSISKLQNQKDLHLTENDVNGLLRFYGKKQRVRYGSGPEDTFIEPERIYGPNIFKRIDGSLNILNASLLAKYNEIFADDSTHVSPFKDNNIVPVLNKKALQYGSMDRQRKEKLHTWIDAMVRRRAAWIKLKPSLNIQDRCNLRVNPLGVYCPDGSDRIKIVFQQCKEHELMEIDIDSIEDKINVLSDVFESNDMFSIKEYLSNKSWEKVIVRIYDKERIEDKLKNVFGERFKVLSENDEYIKAQIEVDDSMKYCELFDSYGRAIIVEKPIELKNEMIKRAKNCRAFYAEIATGGIDKNISG